MSTKVLGQTGVMLPELAFGTWQYNGTADTLRRTVEMGGIFLDTAERYRNEPLVGTAIKGIRDRVFIATKVSAEHFRYNDVLKAAEGSLRALGTDHIDLYQLHWPNDTVPIEENMSAMERLVDAGKVRFIGVSRFPVSLLKKAKGALHKHKIVAHQLSYSLVDRDVEPDVLRYCRADGITVLAFSPLGRRPQSVLNSDSRGALDRISKETGKTKVQIALNWCLCKEQVIPITTASSIAHVEENWGAVGWRLSPEHVRLLNESISFQRRGRMEQAARRLARRVLRLLGRR